MLAKIHNVILKPAKNPDLKDVVLSEAKNLFLFLKEEILRLTASG
jgi:hypothetical protein